ncbi:hypothetical protein BJX66DRAFT_344037 [Aspergillus keveii]|uniref:Uncharacterized protein n=1 Tax=Aspergillus keveii TaxID=714993 RepID=A0ABR4FMZ9_9EURO
MVCETIDTMCEECKTLILETQNFDKLIDCMSVEQPANTMPIVFTHSYNAVELQKVNRVDEVFRAFEVALHDFIQLDEGVIAFHVRCSSDCLYLPSTCNRAVNFSFLVNLPASIKVNNETFTNIIEALKIADAITLRGSVNRVRVIDIDISPFLRSMAICERADQLTDGSLPQQDGARRLETPTPSDTWGCHPCPDLAHANLWRLHWFAEPLRDTTQPVTVWNNLLLYGKRVGRPHGSDGKPSRPFMATITNGHPKVKSPL